MTQLTQQEKSEIESASQIFSRPDNFNQFQQSFSLTALRQSVVTSGLRDVMSNLSNATTQEQKQEAVKFALSTLPKEDRASLIEEANLINYSTRMYSSAFREKLLNTYETVIKPLSEEDRANLIKPQSANHHLRFTEMVKEVQEKVGTHADGKWGPNSEQMARNHGIDIGSVVRDRSETIERNVGNVRNTSNIQTATNTIVDYYSKEENYEEFQKLFRTSQPLRMASNARGENYFRNAVRRLEEANSHEERKRAVEYATNTFSHNFSVFAGVYSDVCSKDPSIEKINFSLRDAPGFENYFRNLNDNTINLAGSVEYWSGAERSVFQTGRENTISATGVIMATSEFLDEISKVNIHLSEGEIEILSKRNDEAIAYLDREHGQIIQNAVDKIEKMGPENFDLIRVFKTVSEGTNNLELDRERRRNFLKTVFRDDGVYQNNILSKHVKGRVDSIVNTSVRNEVNRYLNNEIDEGNLSDMGVRTLINLLQRLPDARDTELDLYISYAYGGLGDRMKSNVSRLASLLTQVPKKNV